MDVRDFAKREHGDQKYGDDMPFMVHLDMVASIVSHYGKDAITIAYLHDILEDTPMQKFTIEKLYGKYIAEAVYFITDEDGPNRKERKRLTNIKLTSIKRYSAHQTSLVVKSADRLANITMSFMKGYAGFLKMYKREHPEFVKAVYRPGLCDEIWERIDKIMTII